MAYVNEEILRTRFGFNDSNVIRGILSDPNQVARYDRELSGGLSPQQQAGMGMPFAFDYEQEAQKAYGELGTYYDRLIREYKGDVNKILSRMVEDYETGKRVRNTAMEQAATGARTQALSRGLYQKSLYNPDLGYGVSQQLIDKSQVPYKEQASQSDLALKRKKEDIATEEERKLFSLEQQRRSEAAGLANTRGSQAYQRYSSALI